MAFRQECHSLYSPEIKAKQWRGIWVNGTATSPSLLIQEWLQLCLEPSAKYARRPVALSKIIPKEESSGIYVVAIQVTDAPINWDALCDAHIDTWFGSQTLLTDFTQADATLYFDVKTSALCAVVFAAQSSQGNINCTITLSPADGLTLQEFPSAGALPTGTLSEEWSIISNPDIPTE